VNIRLDPLYSALYLAAATSTLILSREQRARLEQVRRRRGRPVSELAREALARDRRGAR
jgi:hypothetical protein